MEGNEAAFYDTAVVLVLSLHLAWIVWVIFGALWTSGLRWLTTFHMVSVVWGIVVETGPWDCPLTLAEQFLQRRAGMVPYRGSFLIHYLGAIVYPNLSVLLLTVCGVIVCAVNLLIYLRRWLAWRKMARC